MRSTAAATILLALICFASVEGKSVCHEEDGAEGVLYYKQPEEGVLENHKYLKLTIRRPLKSENTEGNEDTERNEDTEGNEDEEVRIRIWPNPQKEGEDCKTNNHEQELFGNMKQISTFVLSTEGINGYQNGVCLHVEIKDAHGRWNKTSKTDCNAYEVTFEGNGDDTERNVAVASAIGFYIAFSLLFLQIWHCILKTGRFM